MCLACRGREWNKENAYPRSTSTSLNFRNYGVSVMKRSLWSLVWIRRALGVTMILGVVVTMTLRSEKPVASTAKAAVADEGAMPDLGGAIGWINSSPLSRKALAGEWS
jgi:hypothetical protein